MHGHKRRTFPEVKEMVKLYLLSVTRDIWGLALVAFLMVKKTFGNMIQQLMRGKEKLILLVLAEPVQLHSVLAERVISALEFTVFLIIGKTFGNMIPPLICGPKKQISKVVKD